jgi:hypothetical protein
VHRAIAIIAVAALSRLRVPEFISNHSSFSPNRPLPAIVSKDYSDAQTIGTRANKRRTPTDASVSQAELAACRSTPVTPLR